MKRKLSIRHRAALRNLHEERGRKTSARLTEALNRMEAGHPENLVRPFKWTKANLAREAAVHIATLLYKESDGTYRCSSILERFEILRVRLRQMDGRLTSQLPTTDDRLKAMAAQAREREQELAAQVEVICELRAKITDLETRDGLLKNLQTKNTELRESFREIESRCHKLSAQLANQRGAKDDF